MANAKRDDSDVRTGLCWDNTNNTPKRLLIDPVTGRLLIDVSLVASYSPTVHTAGDLDDNHTPIVMATQDNATSNPIPLHADANTNFLLIDLVLG